MELERGQDERSQVRPRFRVRHRHVLGQDLLRRGLQPQAFPPDATVRGVEGHGDEEHGRGDRAYGGGPAARGRGTDGGAQGARWQLRVQGAREVRPQDQALPRGHRVERGEGKDAYPGGHLARAGRRQAVAADRDLHAGGEDHGGGQADRGFDREGHDPVFRAGRDVHERVDPREEGGLAVRSAGVGGYADLADGAGVRPAHAQARGIARAAGPARRVVLAAASVGHAHEARRRAFAPVRLVVVAVGPIRAAAGVLAVPVQTRIERRIGGNVVGADVAAGSAVRDARVGVGFAACRGRAVVVAVRTRDAAGSSGARGRAIDAAAHVAARATVARGRDVRLAAGGGRAVAVVARAGDFALLVHARGRAVHRAANVPARAAVARGRDARLAAGCGRAVVVARHANGVASARGAHTRPVDVAAHDVTRATLVRVRVRIDFATVGVDTVAVAPARVAIRDLALFGRRVARPDRVQSRALGPASPAVARGQKAALTPIGELVSVAVPPICLASPRAGPARANRGGHMVAAASLVASTAVGRRGEDVRLAPGHGRVAVREARGTSRGLAGPCRARFPCVGDVARHAALTAVGQGG